MKRLITLVLVSSFCGSVALATEKADCSNESNYPQISKVELQKAVDKKEAFVVDVNSEDSFKKAHVPGAVHFGSHKDEFAKLLPEKKDTMIVAYCGGPKCTAWKKAAEEACKSGYTNIRHFKPGIKGWVAAK